jgi:AraC-like DNA-binding protein
VTRPVTDELHDILDRQKAAGRMTFIDRVARACALLLTLECDREKFRMMRTERTMAGKTSAFSRFVTQCHDVVGAVEAGREWQTSMRCMLERTFDTFTVSERAVARTIVMNIFVRAFERHSDGELVVPQRTAALLAKGQLREGFLGLLDSIEDGADRQARAPAGDADPRLGPGLTYIRTRYADATLSLADVARHSNLSKWHFDRVLKEVTGGTFRDHLIAIRMVKAKELLESTVLEVKEVADRVGYKHVSHFSRHFKHRHGISATEYRRRSYALRRRNPR